MFKIAVAKNGLAWTPSEFMNSTPREFWLAIEAAEDEAEAARAARS